VRSKIHSRAYRIKATPDGKFRRDLLQYDGASGAHLVVCLTRRKRRLLPLSLLMDRLCKQNKTGTAGLEIIKLQFFTTDVYF
jgi:hypothetical protein